MNVVSSPDLAPVHQFSIGNQRMPVDVIQAIGWIKWAAAVANGELGSLAEPKAAAIATAALRVAGGQFDGAFSLSVWQSASAVRTHSAVSALIARLASDPLRAWSATSIQVHFRDDVDRAQSAGDVFPSAAHIAVALRVKSGLLPSLAQLRKELSTKAGQFVDSASSRHQAPLQSPQSLAQSFSGFEAQLQLCEEVLRNAMKSVHALALGATTSRAVISNAGFGTLVTGLLAERLDLPLVQASNPVAAMAGHEALVALHGALRMLAVALSKIAGTLRLMGVAALLTVGPRQQRLDDSPHPDSRYKDEAFQADPLALVCAQVIGHDAAIGFAAGQCPMEPNIHKPLIVLDTLDSINLLTDAMYAFSAHTVSELRAEKDPVAGDVRYRTEDRSLRL